MLPNLPSDPSQITVIDPGVPVRVLDSYIVGKDLFTVSRPFCFSPSPDRESLQVDYSVKGLIAACTAFLTQSYDGGVTFRDVGVAVNLAANPQGSLLIFFAVAVLVSSPIYKFRIATITAESITIDLAVT